MRTLSLLFCAALVALPAFPALAADPGKREDVKETAKEAARADTDLAPFPAPKSIKQSTVIDGKRIDYVATVGALPVKDDKGKTIGEVVYTAYTVAARANASRPVTFAFNGGPGAASVFLNLGAIGPKKVAFGNPKDSPSDPAVLRDNANSWLDFTDLVFIDPIGTGFSRSRVDEEQTKKAFFAADADIHYLSRIVYDWLLTNHRMTARKYLIGESYGGYRVPRLAYYLQTQLGVGISGMTLVSPYLDPPAIGAEDALSPLPWMINLTAMAAGNRERQGQPVDAQSMAPIEQYDRTEFVQDFLAGPRNKEATDRLSGKVAQLIGLDPTLVRRMNGRVDIGTYLREIRRSQGLVGSVYDSNVTSFDPFPASSEAKYQDPLLETLIAPTTSAMVDFVTHQVGWPIEARFNTLSFDVNGKWDPDNSDTPVTDLRKAMAIDPKMKVTIVHGWNDLSCPYLGSKLLIDQMPTYGVPNRVQLFAYPGGHMFYARPDSGAQLRHDLLGTYQG